MTMFGKPKGKQLALLMDCGDRLHARFQRAYAVYVANPNRDTFNRMDKINDANMRLAKKMKQVVSG